MPFPLIELSQLADGSADAALAGTASRIGFVLLKSQDLSKRLGGEHRAALFRIFDLPETEKRKIPCNVSDPSRPVRTHGWTGPRRDDETCFESMEIGPDLAHGPDMVDDSDPLRQATPVPDETKLPGWRSAATDHYATMERIGSILLTSLARGLGTGADAFAPAFQRGMSSLRLLRYPGRERSAVDSGQARLVAGPPQTRLGEHLDFGCVTLLVQDGVAGLQALSLAGDWLDVPPVEGTVVVSFGRLLERWTGGRIRATPHRVLESPSERRSAAFFFEPRIDTLIAPLAISGGLPFAPFRYRDHVMEARPRLRRLLEKAQLPTTASPEPRLESGLPSGHFRCGARTIKSRQ